MKSLNEIVTIGAEHVKGAYNKDRLVEMLKLLGINKNIVSEIEEFDAAQNIIGWIPIIML